MVEVHRERIEQALVYDALVAKKNETFIVGPAASFCFQVYSSAVTQACLQSTKRLMRDVYLNLSKEMNLEPNQLIKLPNLLIDSPKIVITLVEHSGNILSISRYV